MSIIVLVNILCRLKRVGVLRANPAASEAMRHTADPEKSALINEMSTVTYAVVVHNDIYQPSRSRRTGPGPVG